MEILRDGESFNEIKPMRAGCDCVCVKYDCSCGTDSGCDCVCVHVGDCTS